MKLLAEPPLGLEGFALVSQGDFEGADHLK